MDMDWAVDMDWAMDNVTKVLLTLTVVLGITGNSTVIWMAGFKLKVGLGLVRQRDTPPPQQPPPFPILVFT